MRRSVVAALVAITLATGLSSAHAASLPQSVKALGSSAVSTPRCSTSGLTVIEDLSGSSVVSVTVSSFPSGCGAGTLYAAVNNGTSSSSGSAAIPSTGGSVTVTLAASVSMTTSTEADIVVSGP